MIYAVKKLFLIIFIYVIIQPVSGSIMTDDPDPYNDRDLKAPFVISGNITYTKGAPAWDPNITITNLNTSEHFTIRTDERSNFYRVLTCSDNVSTGDVVKITASDGTQCNETVYKINQNDHKKAGFSLDLTLTSQKPDLTINEYSMIWVCPKSRIFNITYTVKNIGETYANNSMATIQLEHLQVSNDQIPGLKSGENYTCEAGPFNCLFKKSTFNITICADNENVIKEINERNNCLTDDQEYPLPKLYTNKLEISADVYGEYYITYRMDNGAGVYANASNTTINITTIKDGSIISFEVLRDPVPPLKSRDEWPESMHLKTIGPFRCLCNQTVIVEVHADADNEILERNETDNYRNITWSCPESSCKPDLVILNCTDEWITDKTFNIIYTLANIGNGYANNSTTSVHGELYPSPALAPGEKYSGTVGPFDRQNKNLIVIEISGDYFNNVNESNEDNNNLSYTTGVKKIDVYIKPVNWINGVNKTYNITFNIVNYGGLYFDESKAYVYIDSNDTPQAVCEIQGIPVKKDYSTAHCLKKTIGPFTMTGKSDTIRLCIEWEDGSYCKEVVYRYEGCIADDGTLFTCSDVVTKSCTLVQDMNCSTWHSGQRFPNGLFIGADNITIDGNGYAIIGDRNRNSGEYNWIGIRNCEPGSRYSGHENVTIKNLEIRDFQYGITIVKTRNNTVFNCSIHDNGIIDRYHHGIAVEHSDYVTIDQCSIYNNTGIPTNKKQSGGYGISFDDNCNYGTVINSSIFNNYVCGIYSSPTCLCLNITSNLIENNGLCSNSSSCSGINLHWKDGYGLITNSIVKDNIILNNTGSGIYVTQGNATITNNLIRNSRNASGISGSGIRIDGGRLTFLYNNTICDNEGTDISNGYNSFATFGDDNICDTTDNYNDEGTVGCIFYCDGVSGVCKGEHYNFSCGMVINESCIFNRSLKCSGCLMDGLVIGADNITIDGAGYTITGNCSDTGIVSEYTNVTIKNLQVKDFYTGIMIENTNNNSIENCSVRKNIITGINLSTDNCTLINNRIYDNIGPGIVVGGSYNILNNNTAAQQKNSTINATLPGYGIYFTAASMHNNLTGNAIGDNEAIDIFNNNQTYTGDNNTCDTTHNYYDASMLEDKKYGCTYPWTTPDLVTMEKSEFWIDNNNKTYNVKYTVENIAEPGSREAGTSTTYMYIDKHHVGIADDHLDTIEPGSDRTATFDYTATMSGDNDAITVCADGADDVRENNKANNFYCNKIGCYTIEGLFGDREANNCRENIFKEDTDDILIPDENAACVAADGTAYRCNDPYFSTIDQCCTFNGSMKCPEGCGLIIGRKGIIIDGNGSALIGCGNGSCQGIDETNPSSEDGDCGIYNYGYSGVTIKNLEISGFCNGIGLHGSGADTVKTNTIENCKIHDNGNPNSGNGHGIHMTQVRSSTVANNRIYDNSGTGSACGDGGNGIFMYLCCYNTFSTNEIFMNSKGGIFMKRGSESNNIIDNNVYGNGQGGIIIRCVSSGSNTVTDNIVNYNDGDGIFIGSSSNTIRNNRVEDNKAGHKVGDSTVENGDGIDMGRNDGSYYNKVNGNTVCGNEGMDIKTCGKDFENTGTGNYCDNAKDFTGCTYSCADCSKPDLTVTGNSQVWLNPDDRTYDITYFIANIGNVDVDEPIKIQVWIDDTWEEYTVESLQENENYTNTIGPVSMSQINDYIEIIVDPPDAIAEINENNNSLGKIWWAPEFGMDPSPEDPGSSSGGGIRRGEIITSDEQGEAAISGGEGFEETPGNESMISLDTVRNVPARLFKSDSFFGGSEDTVYSSYTWIAVTISALLIILFIVGHYGEKIAHRRNKK